MSWNNSDLEFCTYVHQVFLLHGQIPNYETVEKALHLSRSDYMRLWNKKEVREYLEEQGIVIDGSEEVLLPIQIKLINSLLDYNDPKPDHQKCKNLGISTKQYQTWKSDPAFSNYLRKRVDLIVGGHTDEIDRSLFDAARNGDIAAIKYINLFTGRFKETTNEAVDINFILVKIQEVILRYVTDPIALQNIGRELELLSLGNHARRPVEATIKGELV